MSELQQDLRWALMALCVVVFLGVFAVMLVSLWRQHRSQRGGSANFHDSLAVELGWALAPCLIVLLMVYPTVRAVFKG